MAYNFKSRFLQLFFLNDHCLNYDYDDKVSVTVQVLWLMGAKSKWLAGDVSAARYNNITTFMNSLLFSISM